LKVRRKGRRKRKDDAETQGVARRLRRRIETASTISEIASKK